MESAGNQTETLEERVVRKKARGVYWVDESTTLLRVDERLSRSLESTREGGKSLKYVHQDRQTL